MQEKNPSKRPEVTEYFQHTKCLCRVQINPIETNALLLSRFSIPTVQLPHGTPNLSQPTSQPRFLAASNICENQAAGRVLLGLRTSMSMIREIA